MLKGILLFIVIIVAEQAIAVPGAELWGYWKDSVSTSTKAVDHSRWQSFLDSYLKYSSDSSMHLVDYGRVKKSDKDNLKQYLNSLAVIDPRMLSRDEQLAYWINLYNALTVDLILQYYPVKSITKLGKGWFRMGPWKDTMIRINGQDISLHDIEHRILRPIWKNPKIHYALNCASIGCPDLAPKVYQAGRINDQLIRAGDVFINQKKGLNIVSGRVVLSRIFEWYEDDFGGEKGVRAELIEHANAPMKVRIEQYKGRLSYHYNWQLNEHKTPSKKTSSN